MSENKQKNKQNAKQDNKQDSVPVVEKTTKQDNKQDSVPVVEKSTKQAPSKEVKKKPVAITLKTLVVKHGSDKELTPLLKSLSAYDATAGSTIPKIVVSGQRALYKAILTVINNKDYDKFKREMNLLIEVFKVENSRNFNTLKLLSHDFHWNISGEVRATYQYLMTYISDYSILTRERFVRRYKSNKILNFISKNAVGNFNKYFDIQQ